jgi:hypothetical protein
MLERTETRFGIKPAFLTADSAYGSAESLAWLVKQKKITPHIPVFDKSNRTDGTFSRADFAFDAERDRYICPAGKELVQFRRTYAMSQERRHRGRYADLSRQQIGLRHLQTQSAVLPERCRAQDPAGSA